MSIRIASNIHPDSLKVSYDNGLSIIKVKPVFNNKTAVISGHYYAPFAELILQYPNGTAGDTFEATFYVNHTKATITFLTYEVNTNPLRAYKTEGTLKPEDVGETDFRKFIAAEQRDFSQFIIDNKNRMNDSLVAIAFAKSDKLAQRKVEYVQRNPNKYYAFRVLRKDVVYDYKLNADSLFSLFSLFNKQLQESDEGKEIVRVIRGMHLGKTNAAPDIVAKNATGQSIALRNYRGKYVLLNFWASWCGPCLAEMPAITTIRKHYSPDDLTLVFISHDTDSSAFAKAVKKYQLDGEHLFSNSETLIYAPTLPQVFIIDPTGQIIYSRAEEKDFKLQKIDGILSSKIKRIPKTIFQINILYFSTLILLLFPAKRQKSCQAYRKKSILCQKDNQ